MASCSLQFLPLKFLLPSTGGIVLMRSYVYLYNFYLWGSFSSLKHHALPTTVITLQNLKNDHPLLKVAAVIWPKYDRYGVKPYTIN